MSLLKKGKGLARQDLWLMNTKEKCYTKIVMSGIEVKVCADWDAREATKKKWIKHICPEFMDGFIGT